jgi:hypothetical protein
MTNWYRKPSPISVAKLLLRKGQNLFLDHSLHSSLMKHLPPGSAFLPKPDDDETRERSIRLCQEKHVILITADLGSAPALDSDAGGAWGVILLPDDLSLRLTSCRALPRENSHSGQRRKPRTSLMFARQNRVLLNIRHEPPILSIHSKCRWTI